MRVFVYATLLFPATATPLARLAAAGLHPRHAAWLLSATAVVLAGTSCAALGLLAIAELVRMPRLARLAHLSSRVIVRNDSTSSVVALAAGILFGAALLAALTFTVARIRALANAFGHARALPGRRSLVITEDEVADDYTVPGRPGRIAVSTAMLNALDEPGRRALLAHEQAHVRGRHYIFAAAARLAAAANPLVRPLACSVEYVKPAVTGEAYTRGRRPLIWKS